MGGGAVLGAACSGLIDWPVSDILLPPAGLLFCHGDYENLYLSLSGRTYPSLEPANEAGASTINYGLFITAFIRFIIILFVVFRVVRQVNRWKKPHQRPIDAMMKKECPYCCTPIPVKAIICPNCSSTIEKQQNHSNETAEHPRWRVR